MTTPHQCFRKGSKVVSIAVRKDRISGEAYSRITDVQKFFPDASLFNVNGVFLHYLEDENDQEYEPKRIAHYPDDVIDIVVNGPSHPTTSPSASLSGKVMAQTASRNSSHLSQVLSTDSSELSMSNLSLQPYSIHTSALTRSSTFSSAQYPSPSLSLSNAAAYQSVSIRPMTSLSAIASDIAHIQQQLDRSTDQHSAQHQQLLHQLFYMVQQQNEMLRDLAASKEREEQILREQTESKLRQEQMLKMQQNTIDRLIVAQQRIEAILVQNYELHEYPIPRLFVILPDSYEKWDPRNFMTERFRLFFLCECGDHCKVDAGTNAPSGQLTIAAAASTSPIPVKNSIHLAKHEGYELSRPTEFFDQYGPYVLGMLRILKHCLAVATVAAPAVALAQNGVKDIMDGVKSISERTMEAVNMSIDFLEQKLDENTAADTVAAMKGETDDKDDMFNDLAALEGADLRRLDSFLRKKDADKILGNLYRITIETGHVKWVCLDHYRQVYRDTAMAPFLQCVESNGGIYDPQLGKVTVSLKSSTIARDFFSKLSTQAPAVIALKVVLDWSFGSADLVMLVDKIASSNIRDLELDLQEAAEQRPITSLMRPGKGRYHSLLGLLSNTKMKHLCFINIVFIGPRTSNMLKSHRPSLLQSFHYLGAIHSLDDSRLAEIISSCPNLVDVRLGKFSYGNYGVPKVERALGLLSKLEILHRCQLGDMSTVEIKDTTAPYGVVALRELLDIGMPHPTGLYGLLEDAIQRSAATLEVLILGSDTPDQVLNLARLRNILPPTVPARRPPFFRLTHLDLFVAMTADSLELMTDLLPGLSLVHLGVNNNTCNLLSTVNLVSLQSLCVNSAEQFILGLFYHRVLSLSVPSRIQTMRFRVVSTTQRQLDVFKALPLRRLYLLDLNDDDITAVLHQLNLFQLQILVIDYSTFSTEMETILAARSVEFADGFQLQLEYDGRLQMGQDQKLNTREEHGSSTTLPRHRVRIVDPTITYPEYYAHILPSR